MIKFFRNLLSTTTTTTTTESRSATTFNSNFPWLMGSGTSSGVTVNKNTIVGDSAVWAALRILSNGVASLPWEVYQDNGTTRERFQSHPVDYLINKEPSQLSTSYSFRQSMVWKMFLYGDAYVRIHRDRATAAPYKLELLDSNKVELFENADGTYYYIIKGKGINGTLPNAQAVQLSDMVHLKPISMNGVTGIDIIKTHQENFGLSLAATKFGAKYYANGAHVSGVLESDMDFTEEGAARLRSLFKSKYGGIDNVGEMPVLEQGVKFKKIGADPSEALLIDARKFQVEEVARIFGIPAHMLSAMDKATFNNIEVMSLDFVKNTLRPLCVMIEQEFNRKLFTEKEKRSGTLYTRFNLDGLMRGATKDRFDAYAIAIQNKIMNSNEIRNLENLNPRGGGDKFENPMIQVEENTKKNE